jgi:hypothetical protein
MSRTRQQEAVKKRRYRERLKAARALGLEARADPPIPGRGRVGTGRGQDTGHESPANELIEGLQQLAGDESASGQARVSAARAVLEVQGVLGRNAVSPRDKDLALTPALLTREGLVRELARLRRSILPGTRTQATDNAGDATP